MYATVNPTNGQFLEEFPEMSDEQAARAVSRAAAAYREWRGRSLDLRVRVLRRTADLHRERRVALADIVTLEMGKPVTQALREVDLVAAIYDYYADHAEEFLADEPLRISGTGSAVVRTEAIGVLVGIMPWNYPYYQVARFAAPNLLLGNTILLKHARNCPRSALAIEALLGESGLPDGVYTNVFASNGQIADMIADPRIQGVSLTGSARAGSAVAEIAGRHMKKYVLELGGSDPFIVLDDADIDAAAASAAAGRLQNAGQVCTASKRFIVLAGVYDEFLERYLLHSAGYSSGDPSLPGTRLGPLASDAVRADLDSIVQEAIAQGAKAHIGATIPPGPGSFYPPTLLTDVTRGMRAYEDELFGPAAVLHRVESDAHAVELANDSPFGLSASIFTRDPDRALHIAELLECGMVWINSNSSSSPELPFGGVKSSGVGRELYRYGIDEFANKKLVRVPDLPAP